MTGRSFALLVSGVGIIKRRANDAFVNNLDTLLSDAFIIEWDGISGRIPAIIPDGNKWTHHLFSHPLIHPGTLLLNSQRAHSGPGQHTDQVIRDGWLDNNGIFTGVDLAWVSSTVGFVNGFLPNPFRIKLTHIPSGRLGASCGVIRHGC